MRGIVPCKGRKSGHEALERRRDHRPARAATGQLWPLCQILGSVTLQRIGAALMARIGHVTIKRAVE
jgi:hypothetical protein